MKTLSWFKNSVLGYCKDEEGQTTLEYILLLMVVVAIIFKFKGRVETGLGDVMDDVFKNKIPEIMK